jgi:hypothetical protein
MNADIFPRADNSNVSSMSVMHNRQAVRNMRRIASLLLLFVCHSANADGNLHYEQVRGRQQSSYLRKHINPSNRRLESTDEYAGGGADTWDSNAAYQQALADPNTMHEAQVSPSPPIPQGADFKNIKASKGPNYVKGNQGSMISKDSYLGPSPRMTEVQGYTPTPPPGQTYNKKVIDEFTAASETISQQNNMQLASVTQSTAQNYVSLSAQATIQSTCMLGSTGFYGNAIGTVYDIAFIYQALLTSNATGAIINSQVGPALDTGIAEALLPSFFPECASRRRLQTAAPTIEGVSRLQTDYVVMEPNCTSKMTTLLVALLI